MTDRAIGDRVATARARATAARAQLSATIGTLQQRARPGSVVHSVTETLKDRGTDAVAGLIDTAKSKPARTGAALALVGLFFARHQLIALARRARPSRSPSRAKRKPAP